MSWLPVIALAMAAFVVAAFALRLPKSGWALFGAALLFGLAGYAMHGSPGYAGSPTENVPEANPNNAAMVDARREFFGADSLPSRYVTIADGFARNGQFEDSANMLLNAISQDPSDVEAWVGLGNALVEHADGSLTPAALYAYSQAEQLAPQSPASAYFLGIGLLRSGRPEEARRIWAQLIENAPTDAEWVEPMTLRLERLDAMLTQMGGQQPAASGQ
ncbi:tetratricopeptide repeat protein [Pontixanthobacter aestiaquae]|uniref:Tetratricopeptide repeat protein n=1 Tax=Pontixanthobacter aestiaquae TaxID=1509367 RepID=A0A844Z8M7_9SPHN|nr:tetratricopeptide repeat protein [Pontixanthobacter aestiaquae]MDN3645700.1 tetratricopeptide repeat protein [Pontixanthobacter aestiaquae]MXO83303.1 tetratricopeptide repeat protein [Pontixanthobacter aestiaquae]